MKEYNRLKCVEYARKWAYSRNPAFYDYEKIGGDCTNFISQCIYAGSGVMNYKTWYYKNANDKSPSWTGAEFLYDFLVKNNSKGPQGKEVSQNQVKIGDVIQLSSNGTRFSHSLIVVEIKNINYLSDILVATHSYDVYGKPVGAYNFKKIRFVHIENVYN